jgi:hypothetical protein
MSVREKPVPRRATERSWNFFVEVKCICGYRHSLEREKVVEGLNVSHWKCAACKRRFVIACTPGADDQADQFWPVYLDDVPATGSTVVDGMSLSEMIAQHGIQEIRFQCRCGCRLVGKSEMLGRPCRCPKCISRMIIRAGPGAQSGKTTPILEYLDTPQG